MQRQPGAVITGLDRRMRCDETDQNSRFQFVMNRAEFA
jgi:hypothetical protein